jgi:hypothetical protein
VDGDWRKADDPTNSANRNSRFSRPKQREMRTISMHFRGFFLIVTLAVACESSDRGCARTADCPQNFVRAGNFCRRPDAGTAGIAGAAGITPSGVAGRSGGNSRR